ncbi:exonuclease domain-containing protein [Streptomyces halstedii]|uniref:3'-5' exonuclease n=1 Tax=Streptomyces halstedii TaxID=1944 RepID=UPI003461531E
MIDAATGRKLLDTLVSPGDCEISDGARWVHGISDEMVADKRPFAKILPRLRKVTRDRIVCAYNAEFYPRTPDASQMSHGEGRRQLAAHAGMRAA